MGVYSSRVLGGGREWRVARRDAKRRSGGNRMGNQSRVEVDKEW